jgi:uncharacterized membrane protein
MDNETIGEREMESESRGCTPYMARGAGFWIVAAAAVFVAIQVLGGGWIGLVLAAGLAYFAWRAWGGTDFDIRGGFTGARNRDRAYRVLRERFAKGEIDQEEYETRKGVLFE